VESSDLLLPLRKWRARMERASGQRATLAVVEPIDFDEYVDVLRQRLFDYEAVHDMSDMPHFDELMADYDGVAPDAWPAQAYEELEAQGHLNPTSGRAFGPKSGGTVFGVLSADGRYYVREQRRDAG
jgi:hypothetical protein